MKTKQYNERSMSMKQYGRLKLGEDGMASFMITLIMILVISLIVLGFAQVTRRNQREALDRQLSSEAFYAAESGINVTAHTIQTLVTAGTSLASKNSCSNEYDGTTTGHSAIVPLDGATGSIKYTCVLVNANPTSLLASPTMDTSVVVPIFSSSTPFATLSFQWPKTATDTGVGCTGAQTFPTQNAWTCGEGVLRVDLMKVTTAGTVNADSLSQNTVTLFLTPMGTAPASPPTITFSNPSAYIVTANTGSCTTQCKVTVDVSSAGASQYYARLSMVYRSLDAAHPAAITGILASGGNATFNSQAVIDVTGKAQDELRRIQARVNLVPTADANSIPLNAIASTNSICKTFTIPTTGSILPTATCPN